MNVGSPVNGGGVSGYVYDMTNAAEVQVAISGGLGEADRGGPAFNIIPKTGGNTFSGTVFRQLCRQVGPGEQHRRRLRALGFAERRRSSRTGTPTSPSADRSCATACGSSPTRAPSAHFVETQNLYANMNAGNADAWTWAKDDSVRVRNATSQGSSTAAA